jgi:cytoskeletal protein RodZ
MMSLKLRSVLGMGLAVVIGIALQTPAGFAQDQQQPPSESDQAAPADNSGSSGQTAEPGADSNGSSDTLPGAGDNSAPAPAAEAPQDGSTTAAPTAEPSQDSGATTTEAPANSGGSANVPPVQPEPPAASTEPAPPSPSESAPVTAVNASQLQIGAAVFGADGEKIGEINGVKSDDTGRVQEILVTDGVAAGINAKVFAISADKIASVSDGVKLSLSSEEAKKLPIIDNSNG